MTSARWPRYSLLLLLVCRCDCGDDVPPAPADGGSASDGSTNSDGGTDRDGSTMGRDGSVLLDGAVVDCVPELESITLDPATVMVTLDGGAAAPITFPAEATFTDGHSADLDESTLFWAATRSDDSDPGTVTDGVFTPNSALGGTVTITATDGCVTGTAVVELFLDVTIGAPTNPGEFDGVPDNSGDVPIIVYPSDQTRFPRNIYRTLFQWRTGAGTEFRLTFEGPSSKVTVFTDGAHPLCANKNPEAGCWEADELGWSFIAGSNAGQLVRVTVDGLDRSTNPATVRRGMSIEIGFSKRDVPGAIFYWSTTSAGVRRANI